MTSYLLLMEGTSSFLPSSPAMALRVSIDMAANAAREESGSPYLQESGILLVFDVCEVGAVETAVTSGIQVHPLSKFDCIVGANVLLG